MTGKSTEEKGHLSTPQVCSGSPNCLALVRNLDEPYFLCDQSTIDTGMPEVCPDTPAATEADRINLLRLGLLR
jgi:hypothetical protein